MAKCDNCTADAAYDVNHPATNSQSYCEEHLPAIYKPLNGDLTILHEYVTPLTATLKEKATAYDKPKNKSEAERANNSKDSD